jgi:hypothetical protein
MEDTIIGVYDNEGKTFDRYSIVFKKEDGYKFSDILGLSHNPDSPQGFSQFGYGFKGNHLGKKIPLDTLPKNIKEHISRRCSPYLFQEDL